MEKCFIDESFENKPTLSHASCLLGEKFHFTVAFTAENVPGWCLYESATLICRSALSVSFERIEHIPVRFPCYPTRSDENYMRKTAGLYPDLLIPVSAGAPISVPDGAVFSLFGTVDISESVPAGEHAITVGLLSEKGEEYTETFTLRVINAVLPPQSISVTQWVHYDCIADAHGVPIFSEEHWTYIENYLKTAVEHGINTILTPVFTPPLDTAVGGERPTVQLVDVEKNGDTYRFGFDKFRRFVALCLKLGVKRFEISHLFTQWGAFHAPKIMATENGEYRRIFGWETDAASEEYVGFLRAFIPALLAEASALSISDRLIFHISDEPKKEQLEQYLTVKGKIADLLSDYPIYDALSDFDFYETGAVDHPIPASDHIEPFLEAGINELWTYYCCGQWNKVSNRFIAMPSARTRIIGAQFWKYHISGFLHWGYNFWYTQYSKRQIDPYIISDGDGFAPAGDAYSVYPSPEGKPYRSIRLVIFAEAINDLRALTLAETLCGRDAVLAVLEEEGALTFSSYPKTAKFLLDAREKINRMIEAKI